MYTRKDRYLNFCFIYNDLVVYYCRHFVVTKEGVDVDFQIKIIRAEIPKANATYQHKRNDGQQP